MQTTKVQTSLRIRAVWSAPLLFATYIIPIHAKFEISSLWLVSVAEQAGLSRTWSETPKTSFLVTRQIWCRGGSRVSGIGVWLQTGMVSLISFDGEMHNLPIHCTFSKFSMKMIDVCDDVGSGCHCDVFKYIKLQRDKTNKMTCVPSEDSDQPGHPPCLIRVIAVHMKKPWLLSYPLSTLPRLWSDCVDAQTAWMQGLIWVFIGRTSFCWFCHALAHLTFSYFNFWSFQLFLSVTP